MILPAVKKHADDGFVVGADLGCANAASGERHVIECVERG